MGNRVKPILAITMGDPAGIGPEIAVKAFSNRDTYSKCQPVLIGNADIIKRNMDILGSDLSINVINNINDAVFKFGVIDVFEIETEKSVIDAEFGVVDAKCGDLAFRCVKTAIDLAMAGEVDGTVTGPINKGAISAAGHAFSGHTEIYAHYTNTPKFGMLLADETLKVIHVSTHVSLRQALDLVKKERILDVIQLMNEALLQMGIEKPKIGVAGLNPHASDGGLFGTEEAEEIFPAVEEARRQGFNVEGPIPPDTLFALANGGKFDGCIAMYHDQGHIPFKVVGFKWDRETKAMKSIDGVNITLGLPIIRTSVDHGTAFEIAGKGIASPDALLLAIEYAVRMSN